MMRQRHVARQRDRLLAEFFVLLFLLPQELLRLIKPILGVPQLLSKLFLGHAEFAVFCGQSLSSRALRIPTPKKIPRRFVPRCLVFSDGIEEK